MLFLLLPFQLFETEPQKCDGGYNWETVVFMLATGYHPTPPPNTAYPTSSAFLTNGDYTYLQNKHYVVSSKGWN